MIIGPNTTDFPVCKNRNLIRAVNSHWYQWKIGRGIYLGRVSLSKVFHRFFRLYWGKCILSGGDSRLCPPCNSIAPSLPIISGRFLLCIHYPPPSHSPVHLPPCVYRYLTPSVIVIKHSAAPSGERWLSVTMGGCNGAQ